MFLTACLIAAALVTAAVVGIRTGAVLGHLVATAHGLNDGLVDFGDE